jgi:hypothetical protein
MKAVNITCVLNHIIINANNMIILVTAGIVRQQDGANLADYVSMLDERPTRKKFLKLEQLMKSSGILFYLLISRHWTP